MSQSGSLKNVIYLVLSILFAIIVAYLLKSGSIGDESARKEVSNNTLLDERDYIKRCPIFDEKKGLSLIRLSLNCVDREYPNKPNYVFENDEDLKPPRENTPAFFGCYDWHSAVHAHWSMARILNTYPNIAIKQDIIDVLRNHLSRENISKEMEFLSESRNNIFERPYGWGWLLRLSYELKRSEIEELRNLYHNLKPLSDMIASKFMEYLGKLSRPIREGTHQNTAFSMIHLYDYLTATNEVYLRGELVSIATQFYFEDEDCPINYEPSGEDFISPCLVEADLMRRILPKQEYLRWLDRFLKLERLKRSLSPVSIKAADDPRIGHLIGLFYQRASDLKGIISVIPDNDFRKRFFEQKMDENCSAAEGYISRSGYGGEHWLASFAIYFYTDATIR
jgi:hypothetical protein